MKIETIEQASERIFPHHKGLTIIASNKIMLRRAAFIKGANWNKEANTNIEKAFNCMINEENVIFSERGLSEIKSIYGLTLEQWKIKSINYDYKIDIESESGFVYWGISLESFIF